VRERRGRRRRRQLRDSLVEKKKHDGKKHNPQKIAARKREKGKTLFLAFEGREERKQRREERERERKERERERERE